MKTWNRFYGLGIPVVIAMALSALAVRPAYADGSQPPADSPTGVSAPSSSSSDAGASSQQAGSHQAADDTVRHAALARQKAANPGTSSDPVWCPSGVAPRSSATGGCSGSFPNLSTLTAGPFVPTGNGTIWVETGPASAATFVSGFGTWAAAKNFSLTILGGWNGHNFSMGLAKANPSDPYPLSYFHGLGGDWLSIIGWVGNITLKNLTFNSVNYPSPFNGQTLLVQTQGNITLDRVQVFDAFNGGTGINAGAVLDNTSGLGNVKVTRSQFVHNEGIGLKVLSKGNVTLQSIAADENTDGLSQGAVIDNHFSLFAKPVSVSNSEFDSNGYRGLEISSNGAITLTNLTAQNNVSSRGVDAYNDNFGFQSPITVNGVNNFSNNGFYGISLFSHGAIKVSKTTANYNGDFGVYLDNSAAPSPQPITILGYVIAVGNNNSGLQVYSQGTVSATHLTTNNNMGFGTFIDNTYAPAGFPKPVIISGVNVFNDNHFQSGLRILSDGAVTLANLTARGNGYTDGAYSADVPGVSITNDSLASVQLPVTITGKNAFDHNAGQGLHVVSFGTVTLNNLTAQNNGLGVLDGGGTGVFVDNGGGSLPKPVFIKGTNVSNGNDNYGLTVYSDGAISVSRITTNNNRGDGTYLDNSGSPGQAPVSISGFGVFLSNGFGVTEHIGLEVHSHGALKFANLNASLNYGGGASLNTQGFTSPQPVTLSGHNTFNFNGQTVPGSGLDVHSDGKIAAGNVTASYNNGDGVGLNNYTNWFGSGFARSPIVLVGVNKFINNFNGDGAFIIANGAVLLNHVTANDNAFDGMFIAAGFSPNQLVTIACSSGVDNGIFELSIFNASVITLKGWTESSPPNDFFNVAPHYTSC